MSIRADTLSQPGESGKAVFHLTRVPFPRLPLRPRPAVGESPHGYLLRVSIANGYDSPRGLCKALQQWRYPPDRLLRIGLRLRRRAADVLVGPYPYYSRVNSPPSHSLRVDDFNHAEFRWCPHCLSNSEFVRGEWEIKLCCVCVMHKVVLCDRCPRCNEWQRVARGAIARCACGANLALANASPASAPLIALHEPLIARLNNSPSTGVIDLAPAQWLQMVTYFGQFGLAEPPKRPGYVAGLHHLNIALAITTATADLLTEWPQNFFDLLDRLRADSPDSSRIGDTYGRLYRALYVDLAEPCFQFLRDAFEAYLHEHWFGLLGKRNRRLSEKTINHHPRKPLRIVASNNKTGRSVVKHLAHAGAIDGTAIKHASGRTTWAFPDVALSQVKERLANTLNLGQARKLLGINKCRMYELIDADLLRPWISPAKSKSAAWSLSRKDVQTLARIGTPHAADNSVECRKLVTMHQVLKAWRLQKNEFPAIIRAIQSTALCCYRRASDKVGISAVQFDVEELHAWLDAHRATAKKPMSINAAALVLGVKQQVAYELVRKGLLATVVSEDGTQRGRRITTSAIDEFRNEFVALTELARQRGTGVRRLLTDIPVPPVLGHRVDGTRQYFYRRADLKLPLPGSLPDVVSATVVK